MRKIKFSKLNGQGNDFVLIDSFNENIIFTEDEVKKICDRHFGVGADGIILVKKSSVADLFMDYYNSDGTIAEMCGNGIRCMAKFAFDKNIINKNVFLIETRAGIKIINMEILKDNNVGEIEVNMGIPVFDPEKIPVNIKLLNNEYFDLKNNLNNKVILKSKVGKSDNLNSTELIFNYGLKINSKIYNINCVSMGNPHCIIFLNKDEYLENIDLSGIGPEIENHPFFPKKTNVEFVKVKNDAEISMIVWERGCGETLACGTGACASTVAAIVLNKVKPDYDEYIKVNLKGGILKVKWNGNDKDDVFLKGTVAVSFEGELFLI
ncbi:MAG: diaminopimelate epimerase [Actinobacteria bacterium]|nr:diaminopimelate epimerase [Actinomycetota bacterium]